MSNHLTTVTLRIPADVLADIDAVCHHQRGLRTKFIVSTLRRRLAAEPAAQRAREERETAIKAKAGHPEQLTPEEAAQWVFERLERPTEDLRGDLG